MSRPFWNRATEPTLIQRYVLFGAARRLLSLPPFDPDAGEGIEKLAQVYRRFAEAGIQFDIEPALASGGLQEVRAPREVLGGSRLATCVDIAVTFAGACMDAGLHPTIGILDHDFQGPAHAVVLVCVAAAWTGEGGGPDYWRYAPTASLPSRDDWPMGLRARVHDDGAWVAVDVSLAARRSGRAPKPFDEAVVTGHALLGASRYELATLVDVGRDYRQQAALTAEAEVSSAFLGLDDQLRLFTGLRKNLLSEHLPYIDTNDPTAPSRPNQLIARLTRTESAGILLVGPAGAGKTRTAVEVAQQAASLGQAIVFVQAGEPLATTADLELFVRSQPGDVVLVIIDYLNECQGIDLRMLRQRLIPEAAERGVRVRVLTSCRPGWMSRTSAEVQAAFESVDLDVDDERQQLIIRDIVHRLARAATAQLGHHRLVELCGRRPAIAMLIAVEADRLAQRGRLTATESRVVPGELLGWLERRLSEDGLLPEEARHAVGEDGLVSLPLQICAAVLASTPQPRQDLVQVADLVRADTVLAPERYVDLLLGLGWLVDVQGILTPAHDLVVEQVLRGVFLTFDGHVREAPLARVLSGLLARARTAERYTTSFGRLVDDLDASAASRLANTLDEWYRLHATELGLLVANADEDESSYAVGTLLHTSFCSNAVVGDWDQIIAPWLDRYGETTAARLPYHLGLRGLDDATKLMAHCRRWLDVRVGSHEASFVLAPLLGRRDMPPDILNAAIIHSVAWLRIYCTDLDASWVLGRLLSRPDLPLHTLTDTLTHTTRWLVRHKSKIEAGFVLAPLVSRKDLPPDALTVALTHSIDWLERHATRGDAEFVLTRLLSRKDLPTDTLTATLTHCTKWLDSQDTNADTRFVLTRLLSRNDLPTDTLTVVLTHTIHWLDSHAAEAYAGFVLAQLLSRDDLPGDTLTAALTHTINWLDSHAAEAGAGFVLAPLLSRDDLPGDTLTAALTNTTAWLRIHETEAGAGFVLGRLLRRDDLFGDILTAALTHTTMWLLNQRNRAEARFVLASLLSRADLDPDTLTAALTNTTAWLRIHEAEAGAGIVLGRLLGRADLPCEILTAALIHTAAWLPSHGNRAEARFVLASLLSRADLAPDTLTYTTAWLRGHETEARAGDVLTPLLSRADLPLSTLTAALAHATAWLRIHATEGRAGVVLTSLLSRTDLPADSFTEILTHTTSWLSNHGTSANARFVRAPLLNRTDLPPGVLPSIWRP